MKNTSIFSLFILILLSISANTLGLANTTNKAYKISKLTDIPQNDINHIYQDSRGFIWIGTLDGLHRFDGYDYKTYRMSNSENTINSNMVSAIDEDSKGNIWIATYDKGICKLNPRTETITDFSKQILDKDKSPIYDTEVLCIDLNDVIWIAYKNQLIRLVLDDAMEHVIASTVMLSMQSETKAIYADSNGCLWIGASHHLLRIQNPYAEQDSIITESYQVHVQDICESENEIIAVGAKLYVFDKTDKAQQYQLSTHEGIVGNKILYDQGRIWVGGRNGVACYYRNDDNTWQKNQNFNGDFGSQGLGSNVVFSLLADPTSGLWVGTRGSGINRINLNPKRFEHYKHTTGPHSLSNDIVRCAFQDSYGQVWLGTEERGVNVLRDPERESFDHHFEHLSVNINGLADRVYTIEEMPTPASKEHQSIIWLGTSYYTGMVGVHPLTHETIRRSNELSQVGFAFAMEVYDSMLWVGTYRNGLWRFTMDGYGQVTSSAHYMPGDYEGSVNSDIIRSLLKDSKGNLWVGTDKGLHRVEPDEISKAQPHFKDYTDITSNERFGFDYILQIYEDSEGKIWVGTMGNGLLYYNQEASKQQVSFDRITSKDRLPSNTIKSIVEDDDGYLWLATNYGLSRFNIANRMVTNYDVADGLQANEFSEICGSKLRDGRIIMGGINGFNVFDPKEISPDPSQAKLYLSELFVKNKLVHPQQHINGRILLDKSIEYTDAIKLKYAENSFSIGFIGIHHNSPNKNSYRYILEGFDEEWITTSSRIRRANYTNIPAGKYTFKVNCSNCDNLWCETPAELNIHIKAPFYLSWLAYLCYMLMVSISAYLIWQYRKTKERERHKVLVAEMEKKQVEELSQMRQLFFTNISHEFKTPLTLIKGPIDRLLRHPEAEMTQRLDSYKLIKQNVRIMMRLISQLMDFRRLDQGKMALKYSALEVNVFVETIYTSFCSWAEQKQIMLEFSPYKHALPTTFDAGKMELVIYNLISNAIKNTPQDGKITISIEKGSSNYSIYVSDTGVGISSEDQKKIFERFFQTSDANKRKAGGTGIGLAHAKGLVEKMNGSITFESKEGLGSTFAINMPLENEAATVTQREEPHLEEDIKLDAEKYASVKQTAQTSANADKKMLLIVEDNDDLRHFIEGEFNDDYNILLAEDGEVGLSKAIKSHPDLIISDVMMPNMDGIELCHHIKTSEETSHIPVLLLTAKTSEDAQIKGYSTNADAYITKPFSSEVLKERIKSILNNREAIKEQFQKEIMINPMVIANSDTDVKFMEKVLKLIESNLSDPEFNVEKLALSYGVSRNYLGRKIKALTGQSTIQFQRAIRLKHAAKHLTDSSLTISEIAWKVGYNDNDTFRIRFKEQFKMNPSDYRQQHRPKFEKE